jgi:V8-like Glu-specific endopeptidase
MISINEMTTDEAKPGLVQLTQNTLTDWLQSSAKTKSKYMSQADAPEISFCPGTRYTTQPNPSMCSGFLIAPDLIVTAGHCVEIENMCNEYRWVFDFNVDEQSQTAGIDVKAENIYKCKKVVSHALSSLLNLDYAVIQLEKVVTGREPVEINTSRIADTQSVLVIGNPSGLPTKVADNANVRTNTHPFYFTTNLDTFSGNSGSAVFNADTGSVEGILVRGEEDYVPNYASDACRGEDVSRMTSIPEVGIQKALYAAATTGNMPELKKILKLNFWVDFYTKDGQSALIKASGAAQITAMKALIAKGADVKIKDAKGNTALHELAKVLTSSTEAALKTLVAAGAELEAENADGETALAIASRSLNSEGVSLLIAAGATK